MIYFLSIRDTNFYYSISVPTFVIQKLEQNFYGNSFQVQFQISRKQMVQLLAEKWLF